MNAPSLFHDSVDDALREVVQALGGNKSAGAKLRPELTADDAGKWISDCLNADRAQKLHPAHIVWLLREGRRIGCHAAANFLMRESGYADPQPIEPEDERARLEREFIAAVKVMSGMADRLARLGIKEVA